MTMSRVQLEQREGDVLWGTWLLAGIAAVLALIGNLVAVVGSRSVYGDETADLTNAALAQDVTTAVIVVPVVIAAGSLAVRGHLRAHAIGLGALTFLVYNYAIYCFSIGFGPLFLVWVAVLGLSTFALLNGLLAVERVDLRLVVRPSRFAAAVLSTVAVLFAGLWLSEIVPDLLANRPSTSAADWHVPTNPVHVLDLGVFLPAAFGAGVGLWRGSQFGRALAPVMLVWMVLTCLPIVLTPVVASVRSSDAAWGAVLPVVSIGVLAVVALRHVYAPERP